MYEPIRAKSVHTMADADFPHRSREEELDIQLAGHLSALLAVTDELGLVEAGGDIARQIARLRGGEPVRLSPEAARPAEEGHAADVAGTSAEGAGLAGVGRAELHARALALAGRALVVAASRADTAAAILSAERMDAHTAALAEPPATPGRRLVGAR
ncbi:SCO4983 family protein [Streptomyces liangshanensis]|uniref:SCO4983 family protein n=1 Tax=Streptomyces liangshanensis TaxID=2717324 RepID=UPI0036DF54E7